MLSNWLWISRCGDYWQQAELRTHGACRIMMNDDTALYAIARPSVCPSHGPGRPNNVLWRTIYIENSIHPRMTNILNDDSVSADKPIVRINTLWSSSPWISASSAFPVVPLHTVSVRLVRTFQVKTVQVGEVTSLVPPGSFKAHSTLMASEVLVVSAELLS